MIFVKSAVVGYSGAGKSTFAAALGERLALPVLHLDTVQFLPGWRERDWEVVRAFLSCPAG